MMFCCVCMLCLIYAELGPSMSFTCRRASSSIARLLRISHSTRREGSLWLLPVEAGAETEGTTTTPEPPAALLPDEASLPAEAEAAEFDLSSLTGTAATALAAKFAGYGETLAVAARDLAPHLICVYLKELAADFHTFYNAERVLVDNEAERNARLALCMAARRVLANGLEVLGVSAPERM